MITISSIRSGASGPWNYTYPNAKLDQYTAGGDIEQISMIADIGGSLGQSIVLDVNTDQMEFTAQNLSGSTTVMDIKVDGTDIKTTDGTNTMNQVMNILEGFMIRGDGVKTFIIDRSGKVSTNQLVGPTAKPTLTAWFPIYDTAGSLKGYMPLYQ